jgi:radical SAM protein with 4Fe4S-binding SPASM domain
MTAREWLSKLLVPTPVEPPAPIQPGLYHYMRSAGQEEYEAGAYTRFHLRVDPDGHGLLLANASAAIHLSPSGALIAKGLLEDQGEQQIMARLRSSFRGADQETMKTDLERVAGLIAALVAPGDNYPVMNLEDAELSPYDAQLMAPFQADVVLAPPAQMTPILDKLWQADIPHVTFMAAQPDVPDHLVQAVERAEDLGMIAGIRARATDIGDPSLLADLAMAGLDHCNVVYLSAAAEAHDRLCGAGDHERALALFKALHEREVSPVADLPLLEDAATTLRPALDLLLELRVSNVNFLTIVAPNDMPDQDRSGCLTASALPQMADLVEEMAAAMDVRFIWQPPVRREPNVALSEQIRLGPRCTSDLSIRVLPNGDVLPPRGPAVPAGNLLAEPWEVIWGNPAFVNYRQRVERPTRCEECPGLVICAADCPREPAGWSQGLGDSNR